MISINVKLFGGFRQLAGKTEMHLEIPKGVSVSEIRKILFEHMKLLTLQHEKLELIWNSLLADENQLLSDETKIHHSLTLALLPPFSGG